MKPIFKEFILNFFLFYAFLAYADYVLVPDVPFSSQCVALCLMAFFIVDAYINSVERYGIKPLFCHHLCLGGAAVVLLTLGQFSMEELGGIGFNFSEKEKYGYYQYLAIKSILNLSGVFALPSLIAFARKKLKRR
ncbi:hypothetical protein BKG93_04400 [Rodentibacter ratti]|uniref:Uncharacterized protein n=1 Tax=Rodentibacter ratti TaxID=1906745 RepID=A0A1V3L6P9_9PAST|nr:hypothetical protein [Rodentibacter ratti]OOF85614.1 hypothetical protein BKG93_04400 [Rodentibacter ratti]